MIERRGEHKMFISPQSLKMPSLFKHLPFPKAHTPPTLRVLPKIPTKKIRVAPSCSELLRAAPSAPQKAIVQNAPHHFVIAPRPTTHYLCFQKSQISHVHKHNAFQFRLRNRNISSS